MSMMFKGKFVVLALILLTVGVGALFITLGPKALKTSPGVFHLGIRYADELTMDFTQYPKGGPGALLQIFDIQGKRVLKQGALHIGRNLIPLDREQLENGEDFLLQIHADGYIPLYIPATLSGRSLNPAPDDAAQWIARGWHGINADIPVHQDYSFQANLLGVRLYPNDTSQ